MPVDSVSIAVIGGGPWGLALAAAAGRNGKGALLYSRSDRRGALPPHVTQARDYRECAERARLLLLAVPSDTARQVARELGDVVDGRHLVVHGVRGLSGEALDTISEVVRQETPARRVGAIGGPVLPGDLLNARPGVLLTGSHYPEVNAAVTAALASSTLRVYATDDLRGLEWASALVGCLAVGIGYAQALGASPGLAAAAITRAVSEAARLATAAGGEGQTLFGLAGYGDLLAAMGQERAEILFGRALAQGKSLEDATREAKLRVEAVELIPRIARWAEGRGVRAPIFTALARGVLSSQPAQEIVHALMTAPIHDEG